jgi:hypothetical protein
LVPGIGAMSLPCASSQASATCAGVVGDLSLAYEVMELSVDTGLTLTAYSPEPNSPSEDGLALLASWAATKDKSSQSESV